MILTAFMRKMLILIMVPLFHMFAEATIRDEDIEELNKIILKEIQLKREAIEILKADTRKSDVSSYHNTDSDISKSDLPLSLNNKWRNDVTGINNGDEKAREMVPVKKDHEEISLKRDIKNVILKNDITDALVDILYDRLKNNRENDELTYSKNNNENILRSIHTKMDVSPTSHVTLGGTRKAVIIDRTEEAGSNPPGIWGRGIQGPPGLWGKKDEENSNHDSAMTTTGSHPGPPGLWGRGAQVLNKRSASPPVQRWGRWSGREAHEHKLSDLTEFLQNHEQDLWPKKFEKKTMKEKMNRIMT